MSVLHVFSDDEEFVVAADEDDARAVMHGFGGPDVWGDGQEINQEPDDVMFSIIGEDGAQIRKTFGEWAASHGRGYLCASADLS